LICYFTLAENPRHPIYLHISIYSTQITEFALNLTVTYGDLLG